MVVTQQQIKYAINQVQSMREDALNSLPYYQKDCMADKDKLKALKSGEYKIDTSKLSGYRGSWAECIVFDGEVKNESEYNKKKEDRQRKIEKIEAMAQEASNKIMLGDKGELLSVLTDLAKKLKAIK